MTDEPTGVWEYPLGSKIREREEFGVSIGGHELELSEYVIRRCLIDIETAERFYHVATHGDGTHLYAASAIEGNYEVVETNHD